jgi:hypothetical protein
MVKEEANLIEKAAQERQLEIEKLVDTQAELFNKSFEKVGEETKKLSKCCEEKTLELKKGLSAN